MRSSDQRDQGSATVWVLVTAMSLVLVLGLGVDLAGQVRAKQRAQAVAAEAARVGGQQLAPSGVVRGQPVAVDPARAAAAAQTYLAGAQEVSGSVSLVDGTRVVVETSATYSPRFLSAVGISSLTVRGHAEVQAVRAVGGVEQ